MRPLFVCRFLENKSYHTGVPAEAPKERKAPETPHWCTKTLLPIGPDGKDVREDRCSSPDRPCFHPQVQL